MPKTPIFRTLPLLGLALALLAFSGCARNKCALTIDDAYSVNIVKPPPCFPEEIEELTPAQQEVYARYGRPEYIRYWWNPDGDFVTSSDLISMIDKIEQFMLDQRKSWIYYYDDMEIVFDPQDAGYDAPVKPKELTKIVCRYGDPSDINVMDVNGVTQQNWIYIDHGFILEVIDGRVTNRQTIDRTGVGTIIGK